MIGPLKAKVLFSNQDARQRMLQLVEDAARGGQPVTVREFYEQNWWLEVDIGLPSPDNTNPKAGAPEHG